MDAKPDAGDLRDCIICARRVEPPINDPLLVVERSESYESLNRFGFLVHEACLERVAEPAMRERISARLAGARSSS
jgi:hypothetical protein